MQLSPYQQKANDIISSVIKSAVFIDEKARGFFETKSEKEILEETLSVDLYNNFKKQKIFAKCHFEQR